MAVSVAKVYADAFFGVVGGQLDSALAELRAFAEQCAGSPPLQTVLMGAAVDPGARLQILEDVIKALGVGERPRRLLLLLLRRSRLSLVGAIVRELELLKDGSEGVLSGELTAAVAIDAQEVEGLAGALSKRVGQRIKLHQKTDPAVLGGFVATVAGKTYDASLRTQLKRIRNELI